MGADKARISRSLVVFALGSLSAVFAGPGLAAIASNSAGAHITCPPLRTGQRCEVSGGVLQTWTDYKTGGGVQGNNVPKHSAVAISCRIRGLKISDGNTWWYRLATRPWRGRFYASADGFYNNGHDRGSLHGTPFVDRHVRLCKIGGS